MSETDKSGEPAPASIGTDNSGTRVVARAPSPVVDAREQIAAALKGAQEALHAVRAERDALSQRIALLVGEERELAATHNALNRRPITRRRGPKPAAGDKAK